MTELWLSIPCVLLAVGNWLILVMQWCWLPKVLLSVLQLLCACVWLMVPGLGESLPWVRHSLSIGLLGPRHVLHKRLLGQDMGPSLLGLGHELDPWLLITIWLGCWHILHYWLLILRPSSCIDLFQV